MAEAHSAFADGATVLEAEPGLPCQGQSVPDGGQMPEVGPTLAGDRHD
jgi:hypothetical protein